jgi:hypothetical protein
MKKNTVKNLAAPWANSEMKGKLMIGCISADFTGYLYLNHHVLPLSTKITTVHTLLRIKWLTFKNCINRTK